MNRMLRGRVAGQRLSGVVLAVLLALVGLLTLGGAFSPASGDIDSFDSTNVHEGDNDNETDQDGAGTSGDAVVGQVGGVVSSGDASVDATNRSEDVDAESGDVEGRNDIASIAANVVVEGDCPPPADAGAADCPGASDINSIDSTIVHEGDNDFEGNQSQTLTTGDVVGGQVIGVVASGIADVVAANTSRDVDLESGDAEGLNEIDALAANFVAVGGECCPVPGVPGATDINSAFATIVHEGDNDLSADQVLSLATGDVVGGQVIGVVSSGDASVDATNLSEDVEAESGDAEGVNDFEGAAADVVIADGGAGGGLLPVADIDSASATVVHEGDNDVSSDQDFDVSTGDSVGGQIIGVVAAGTVDVVGANTSVDTDTSSGESDGVNDFDAFSGNIVTDGALVIGDPVEGVIDVT